MRSRKVSARGRAGDAFPSSEDDWKRTCQLDVAPRARKRGRHGRGRTGDAADGDEPALAVVLAADRVSRAVARGNGKKSWINTRVHESMENQTRRTRSCPSQRR